MPGIQTLGGDLSQLMIPYYPRLPVAKRDIDITGVGIEPPIAPTVTIFPMRCLCFSGMSISLALPPNLNVDIIASGSPAYPTGIAAPE